MGEGNASEIQRFDGHRDSMNRCGVRQDCLDVAQIHADRNGTSALGRAFFSEFYWPFAIKFVVAKLTKPSIKKGQAGILRAPDLLADSLKIPSVKCDKIAKELDISRSCCRWFPTINSPLDIQRPFFGVFPA